VHRAGPAVGKIELRGALCEGHGSGSGPGPIKARNRAGPFWKIELRGASRECHGSGSGPGPIEALHCAGPAVRKIELRGALREGHGSGRGPGPIGVNVRRVPPMKDERTAVPIEVRRLERSNLGSSNRQLL
jgi:hypothetical protein